MIALWWIISVLFVNVLGQDEVGLDDLIASILANETAAPGVNITGPTTASSMKVSRISHSHTATQSNWCVFL